MKFPARNPGSTGAGVGDVDASPAGNIIIRVGREHAAGGWEQTEYVVFEPEVARAFAREVLCQAETVIGRREIARTS